MVLLVWLIVYPLVLVLVEGFRGPEGWTLEDAGSRLSRVVKVTCFMANPGAFGTLNALFAELFPEAPPVRSVPIVKLPKGLLFSIEAIAAADKPI